MIDRDNALHLPRADRRDGDRSHRSRATILNPSPPGLRAGPGPRRRDRVDRHRRRADRHEPAPRRRALRARLRPRGRRVGSGENLEAYPGLAEHAFRLKSFDDCFRLKNHVIEMLELADIETRSGGAPPAAHVLRRRRRLLGHRARGRARRPRAAARRSASTGGSGAEECRVVVVHPGPTLLPELYGSKNTERDERSYPKLVEYGMNHSREARRRADAGDEGRRRDAERGRTSRTASTSRRGRSSARSARSRGRCSTTSRLPRDERGRLVTDEFLRVDGRDDLWAGGDCAAVRHPRRRHVPAGRALRHQARQRTSARTSGARSRAKPLRPFRSDVIGQGISIGNRTAVGDAQGDPDEREDRVDRVAKRDLGRRYPDLGPSSSAARRLARSGRFVGRDIVQMGPSQITAYDVRHHVYQPGETIADSARPVRLVHVIVEGEVEIVRDGRTAAARSVLETIGARRPLRAQVARAAEAPTLARAKSLVRTMALHEDQANQLQDVLLSTERIVARTERCSRRSTLSALQRELREA